MPGRRGKRREKGRNHSRALSARGREEGKGEGWFTLIKVDNWKDIKRLLAMSCSDKLH